MAKIELSDLDANLDNLQLVELSDRESAAITGGALGAVGGYIGGLGAALFSGERRASRLIGIAGSTALGGTIAGAVGGPLGASLSTPE